MNQDELDELFITVRDGELAEAREALEKADMSWLHSAFRQNMLFLWQLVVAAGALYKKQVRNLGVGR